MNTLNEKEDDPKDWVPPWLSPKEQVEYKRRVDKGGILRYNLYLEFGSEPDEFVEDNEYLDEDTIYKLQQLYDLMIENGDIPMPEAFGITMLAKDLIDDCVDVWIDAKRKEIAAKKL